MDETRMQRGARGMAGLLSLGLLAACSGDYSGSTGGGNAGPSPGGGDLRGLEDFYAQRIEPRLAFCRTCHVPGGVADVEDGRRFMLGQRPGNDYALLRASWEALGGNNPESRILLMASGRDARSHSGGAPWPQGSDAYRDMAIMLGCFEQPAGCLDGAGGGPVAEEAPLLGSKRAQHVWASYCEGKDDSAVLPADPRTLVQPGTIATDRAVFFNAYWEDCHAHMPEAERQAKTCGEYRARRDRGLAFLIDELPVGAMSAEEYNNTWRKWGLPGRPDNFDQLYTLRYGLNYAPFYNPYPLPGEDPNATNGGSGRLPLGLRQLKDENGRWTGEIGTAACFQCHGGQIGEPAIGEHLLTLENLGLGNNNYDVVISGQDASPFAGTYVSTLLPPLSIDALFNIGIKQRGQNNAVGAFEFLVTVLDLDSLGLNPNPLKTVVGVTGVIDIAHPLAHTQDTPPWWNMGSRPRKFFDAGVSNDSTRIIMAAGPGEFEELVSASGEAYRTRIEQYDQDLEAFFLSLRSPAWPGTIDTALAEQGAVLFHTKDLWAEPGNADAPRPLGGNGSCASCHGAYSPRYVNDPAYLQTPALEGVAAHIVPLAVIGTDPARSDMLTPTLRERWDTTFWGYNDAAADYVAPEDKDPLTELLDDMYPLALRPMGACGWEKTVIGYQAPPLYGVWATAPYFHNGSVPTLEQVLDSSKRPAIWQRQLQEDQGIKGFDQRFGAAFDQQAVGWKHRVLDCTEIPGSAIANCNPVDDQGPSLVQMTQNFLNGLVSWTGLVNIPDPVPGAVDKRLVYDTRILGNGNGGHTFSDVLTEAERRAIIEYLKTL
ncbi:putative rubber dioxygenase RoxC [Sinimarinibacterium thermocellulolyticum]|uniref:Cytochrome c domain-containing protein n=1 Tax=Sinimarinibacterium thermocellulolyticum TaxID=3170016 RepID=A0ABV2A9G4_9GAMM